MPSKPPSPRKGGKSGKNRAMTGEELGAREQLLTAARAKLHAQRGEPVDGTSWRLLAKTIGVRPSTLLRDGLHRPSVDEKLRRFMAADVES